MTYARLHKIEQALNRQYYSAVWDWNARGWPANRVKGLMRLQALAEAAWCAAHAAKPPLYDGPVERGVDPVPAPA